jgi:uncharacterized protein with ParB-like and HNH nuclease domain
MSKDLIFSIADIFNTTTTAGTLNQYGAERYYIAPYQRGYKWAARYDNDPVCILMKDLLNASENPLSDYYLQFITTKLSKADDVNVMEVIDGQQRLTTLTILLSVLTFKKNNNQIAISNNLLSYEVRPKVTQFFADYIYKNIAYILSVPWFEFIKAFPENDEQDIYYLFNAANKISTLVDNNLPDITAITTFEQYVLDQVKIILNNVERNISCEEIFSNLNGNKVDLTSSELIKGLFLTNSAREDKGRESKRTTYKEILEMRAVMGRQWDEIAHWSNRSDIKAFYFPNSANVLDDLLMLMALKNGFSPSTDRTDKNEVFNYFQTQTRKGAKTTTEYFSELKKLKLILNEWFNDNEIYNRLGFIFFIKTRGERTTVKKLLPFLEKNKTEFKSHLNAETNKILNLDINILEYGQDNNEIHNILLALSIFSDAKRFDFKAFTTNNLWSLEHIFPQNPDDLPSEMGTKDIQLIKSLGGDKLQDYDKIRDRLKDLDESIDTAETYQSLKKKLQKNSCALTIDERNVLYRLIQVYKLNSIGNMALLTKSDNSSNKNGMFDKKRHNIAKRVSNGSFVPRHTYDVFSKLISNKMSPELNVWTDYDIEIHKEWINTKIIDIKSRITQ